jgi:hypothetical protein
VDEERASRLLSVFADLFTPKSHNRNCDDYSKIRRNSLPAKLSVQFVSYVTGPYPTNTPPPSPLKNRSSRQAILRKDNTMNDLQMAPHADQLTISLKTDAF